jgi:hypothetical protein
MSFIITGERIQQLCDVYLGHEIDFYNNPVISKQKDKHVYLNNINEVFDNPYYIFCYGHNINIFAEKIHFFKNFFILITHNSDQNIENTNITNNILNNNNILKWYAQNICFEHPKLYFLPIGIANSKWSHGNLSLFNDINFISNICKKKKVFFNFNIYTNKTKRNICYNILKNNLNWINNTDYLNYLNQLKDYEFCICPEGNGVDTHRLWECLYLKVVPIVINSSFSKILKKNNIPIVILDTWDEFDENKLVYNDFNFQNERLNKILDITNYFEKI